MKIMMGVLSSSWWCEELSRFFISWFRKGRDAISFLSLLPQMKEKNSSSSVYSKENEEEEEDVSVSLLDLPDLTLECIFEKLPPSGLLSMSTVSTSLREKCTSDHLWEKHMNHKWGSLIVSSAAAYREWQCYIASRNRTSSLLEYSSKKRELLGKFSKLSWNSRSSKINNSKVTSCSVMDWYLSLETGNFWFPAQIFNRENGHVGFMLSCYDAEVSYDSGTNTFKARYPEQGRRKIEENIGWNRLRAPSVETPAHVLHVSDCLNDLKPDDHIEIQWRKSKEFPYGWWYGVVGHFESCNGNMLNCNCHTSETVKLEFKQYNPGSKWRQMVVSRNDHREVGNEADGFYGGIRKLYNEEEISMWKGLWPSSTFE